MNDARRAVGTSERERLERAIAEAESSTAAEIVCAVATESGRYDRAESLVGLGFGLMALGLAHAVQNGLMLHAGEWSTGYGVGFAWQCLAVVLGFATGSVLASFAHPLRAPFISAAEMEQEVWRSARFVMSLPKADAAESGAAIVIYASLFERRVVVLAGKASLAALGEAGLQRIRDAALADLARGKAGDAMAAAVSEAARLCASALPPRERNANELANHVLVFHPRPA